MPQFEYFLGGPRRAMLGVNIDGTEPNGGGVRVGGVSPGGPAAEAGVKAGDIIVSVRSKPVATGRELVRAMETVEPGEKVELGLKRDGKPLKLSVEARPLDDVFFTAAVPAIAAIPAIPPLPAIAGFPPDGEAHWLLEDWGDAEFVTLTPGLGRYFGADKGVLVARAGRRDARPEGRRRHRLDRRPRAAEQPARDAHPALVPTGRVGRAQDHAGPPHADAE